MLAIKITNKRTWEVEVETVFLVESTGNIPSNIFITSCVGSLNNLFHLVSLCEGEKRYDILTMLSKPEEAESRIEDVIRQIRRVFSEFQSIKLPEDRCVVLESEYGIAH